MKKARKKSPWMQHVAKQMAAMPGVALREVLKAASKTYKKGKGVTKKVLGIRKTKKTKKRSRRRRRRRRPRRTRRRPRRHKRRKR